MKTVQTEIRREEVYTIMQRAFGTLAIALSISSVGRSARGIEARVEIEKSSLPAMRFFGEDRGRNLTNTKVDLDQELRRAHLRFEVMNLLLPILAGGAIFTHSGLRVFFTLVEESVEAQS